MVDPPQGGNVNCLPSNNTSRSNPSCIFPWPAENITEIDNSSLAFCLIQVKIIQVKENEVFNNHILAKMIKIKINKEEECLHKPSPKERCISKSSSHLIYAVEKVKLLDDLVLNLHIEINLQSYQTYLTRYGSLIM